MASLPRIRRAGIVSGVASVASGRLSSELYAITLRAAAGAMLPVYGFWMDGSLMGGRLGCMNRGNAGMASLPLGRRAGITSRVAWAVPGCLRFEMYALPSVQPLATCNHIPIKDGWL